MLPVRIEGATRILGAPANWNPETDGFCGGLAIRDEHDDGPPRMISAWEPTPEEVAALIAGGRIMLSVVGVGHPPVWIFVATAPEPVTA